MREGGLSGPPFSFSFGPIAHVLLQFAPIQGKIRDSPLRARVICASHLKEVRHFGNNLRTCRHFPVIEALTICNVLVNSRSIARKS